MDQDSANKNEGRLTRRGLFDAASLTAAGIAAATLMAPEAKAVPKKGAKHDPLEPFKFDLESSEGWEGEGGSAKQATIAELPVSQSIAGVSMRLKPGGLRELHWHAIAAEWALVLKGRVRATVISPNGQAESADFGPGDVWYFPKGHGHALQGLGPEEAHFILVFDDGHFSEYGTFSITEWVALTPPAIAAKNLGVPVSVLANFPKSEAYICPGKVPPAIPEDLRNGDPNTNQFPHKFRLGEMKPTRLYPGGNIRVVSSKEFPIQTTLTAALQELKPGAVREMHWHPNADEWQYYIGGRARLTVFGAHGRVATEEFSTGHVSFIKQGFGHFVEQIGPEPVKFLAMFNSPVYEEISISGWLGANPPAMIADNFGTTKSVVERMPKAALGIMG